MTQLNPQQLENGVRLAFEDTTNRYYGDYHRVKIEVRIRLAENGYERAYDFKALEKMAVPGAEVDAVRQQLLENFRQQLLPYLARPDFAQRFLATQRRQGLRLLRN